METSDSRKMDGSITFSRFKFISFRKSLAIAWLAFASLDVNCQKIDSMEVLLPNKAGHDRAELLYQLAFEYIDIDDYLAREYSREAFNIAISSGDSLLLVKAGRVHALALARLESGDSSIALSLKILPIARRNGYDYELKHILNRLGAGYLLEGNYDSALIFNFESLAMREKSGDPFEVSVALNNIGLVYYTLKNYDKALSFYRRSEESKEKSNNKEGLDLVLLNISLCYAYKSQFTMANDYVNRALEQCGKNCSKYFSMMSNFNLAFISKGLSDLDYAEHQFSRSFLLAKELGNVRFQLENLVYLLEIARMKNSLDSRTWLLAEAEALLDEDVSYRLVSMKLCHELFDAYGSLENSKKKSFYQSKYIQLKDSTFNEEHTTNLMKVEADYMERENKAKLEAQEKILMLNKDIMSKQRVLNVVVGIVAMMSIFLVIVLIKNVKQKKHANSLLEDKVKERTIELELNHNLLLKAMLERDVQFKRMSNEIKSSLATIKGLGVLVSHDVGTINGSDYLAKIEETSNNLLRGLNRVHDQQF